jgi:hypothetical protein
LHNPHECEIPGESRILACGCGCEREKALNGQIPACERGILASRPRDMLRLDGSSRFSNATVH